MNKKEYEQQLHKLEKDYKASKSKTKSKRKIYENFLVEGNKFIKCSDYHYMECFACTKIKPKNLMIQDDFGWYRCKKCYSKLGNHR